MKRILGGVTFTVWALGVFPAHVGAGALDFNRTTCDQGVSVAWTVDAGLHTSPQQPAVDVWSMVVDGLFVNGEPVDFRTIDAVSVQTDPLTASGIVDIEIVLHWHADRPDGTSYDSPPLRRMGTVSCSSSVMPTSPGRDPASPLDDPVPTMIGEEAISRAGELPASGTSPGPLLVAAFGLVAVGMATRRSAKRRRRAYGLDNH